jgi:hypothetical protein
MESELGVTKDDTAEVRMFGVLHTHQRERGLPTRFTIDVPAEGMTARDVALAVGAPLEHIEGVFCNGTIYGPGHVVMPGDRVAFVPKGTPGPHRFALGLWKAGQEPWTEEPVAG